MVRRYEPKDYPMIKKWWEAWGLPAVFDFLLPPVGLIANDRACVFIYQTDSPIVWVEWLVSDKEVPFELRNEAIDEVLKEAEVVVLGLGKTVIFSTTDKHSLRVRLVSHGYAIGDTNVTHLTKNIREKPCLQEF